MIQFLIILNDVGKLIFSCHFKDIDSKDKATLESNVARKCFLRKKSECHFLEYDSFTLIYRQYGSIMIIAAASEDENELAVYEFVNLFMETLDVYFHKVTEAHILTNLDKVHIIIQEMIVNGQLVGTSPKRNLLPIMMLDRLTTTAK